MVKRCAMAMIDDDPTMFGYHISHIKAKESAVRAVISVIRKPTPEMIKAGSRKVSCYIADFYVAEMFTEMIDEMLK